MSRTNRGEKGPGHEYWSRRSDEYFMDPGKDAKKRTHRGERRQAKEDIEQLLEEDEDDDC